MGRFQMKRDVQLCFATLSEVLVLRRLFKISDSESEHIPAGRR
jgi:hypothetical protein